MLQFFFIRPHSNPILLKMAHSKTEFSHTLAISWMIIKRSNSVETNSTLYPQTPLSHKEISDCTSCAAKVCLPRRAKQSCRHLNTRSHKVISILQFNLSDVKNATVWLSQCWKIWRVLWTVLSSVTYWNSSCPFFKTKHPDKEINPPARNEVQRTGCHCGMKQSDPL